MPSIVNVQRSVSMDCVGPAVRIGKPGSAYWPGGSRSSSPSGARRRPRNPRETKSPTSARPERRGRKTRAALDLRNQQVDPVDEAPRPVLAGFERSHGWRMALLAVGGGGAVGPAVTAAGLTALKADPQVNPRAAGLWAILTALDRLINGLHPC